jgi:hypothetical protein
MMRAGHAHLAVAHSAYALAAMLAADLVNMRPQRAARLCRLALCSKICAELAHQKLVESVSAMVGKPAARLAVASIKL